MTPTEQLASLLVDMHRATQLCEAVIQEGASTSPGKDLLAQVFLAHLQALATASAAALVVYRQAMTAPSDAQGNRTHEGAS